MEDLFPKTAEKLEWLDEQRAEDAAEIFEKFNLINGLKVAAIALFLIFLSLLRLIFNFGISANVIVWIAVLFSLTLVFGLIARKMKFSAKKENAYFAYFLTELLILTLIIHYLGGVEWIGVILYVFVAVQSIFLFSSKKGVLLSLAAVFFYGTLVFLEYFGIIAHAPFFIKGGDLYLNFSYVSLTFLTGSVIIFFYIGFIGSINSALLKNQVQKLIGAGREIKEARDVLEVRVRARTKELEEISINLEDRAKEQTKELQEKIKELERFKKLAIGRELKMIELKKEINHLKKIG